MKLNKQIDWEFEEEEFYDDIEYPVILDILTEKKYYDLLNKLNIGDRFEFSFYIDYPFLQRGTILYIDREVGIGIEFDEMIRHCHNGNNFFNGKEGHCWIFDFGSMTYQLKIIKRV